MGHNEAPSPGDDSTQTGPSGHDGAPSAGPPWPDPNRRFPSGA